MSLVFAMSYHIIFLINLYNTFLPWKYNYINKPDVELILFIKNEKVSVFIIHL
jgi:hypothetical protein